MTVCKKNEGDFKKAGTSCFGKIDKCSTDKYEVKGEIPMLHASTMMPGKVSAMGKVYEEVAALAYQR